jgi:hypothetical protein
MPREKPDTTSPPRVVEPRPAKCVGGHRLGIGDAVEPAEKHQVLERGELE